MEAMGGLQKEICMQVPRAELLKRCMVDPLQQSQPETFMKNANHLAHFTPTGYRYRGGRARECKFYPSFQEGFLMQ